MTTTMRNVRRFDMPARARRPYREGTAAEVTEPVGDVECDTGGDPGANCEAEEGSYAREGNSADDEAGGNGRSRQQSAASPPGAGVAT